MTVEGFTLQDAAMVLLLVLLSLYFLVRHVVFSVMVLDVILVRLRRFGWFPGEGRRRKAVTDWLIAFFALQGVLALSWATGLFPFRQ